MNTNTTAGTIPGYSRVFAIMSLLLLSSFFTPAVLSNAASNTEFRWSRDLIGAFAAFRKAAGDRVFGLTLVGGDGWLFLAKRRPYRTTSIPSGCGRKCCLHCRHSSIAWMPT